MRQMSGKRLRFVRLAQAFLWCALVVLAGCRTPIQHGLSEAEANEILVLLEEHGIAGSKDRDGRSERWMVSVPGDDASRSWQIMQANGLPRRPVRGFEQTLEDSGLIPTPTEDRIRIQQAIAGELERSLMAMDAVLDARVHLVVPETDRLRVADDSQQPARASVLVVYQQREDDPDPVRVDAVQRLVAGAVEGLEPAHVVVVTTGRRVEVVQTGEGLAHLGPWTVSGSSKVSLQIVILLLVVLNLLLGGGLGYLVIRQRRTRISRT